MPITPILRLVVYTTIIRQPTSCWWEKETMNHALSLRHLIIGIGTFLLIMVAGVVGYRLIEGWSLLDSLFMTVITLTTVGYGEVHPLSPAGKTFSIALIVGGGGSALYILTTLIPYTLEIIGSEFGIRFGRRRMESKIQKLHNHFILCGYGRVGQEIAEVFKQEKVEFVVIDRDQKAINEASQAAFLCIQDDPTKDEVLRQAGIDGARGLVAALGTDADNTYVTLSARTLNPTLPIFARAGSPDAEEKLRRAGATRVISPYVIGGRRLALLALRPVAVDFVETVLFNMKQRLLLEEMEIEENSALAHLTIRQLEERYPGTKVVAVKRHDGTLLLAPEPTITIEGKDEITVFGASDQLQALENCCHL